ncbi:MAG: phosphate acyltransferase [Syntrophotaleaceae bacterium]
MRPWCPRSAPAGAPDSTVAGKANTLVFPTLDAGNIGYKLVQRLASYQAVSPRHSGAGRAVSDLSRGCSVDDIISVTAITAVQAQG